MLFDLPKSLEVGGKRWPIRSDFRDVLTVVLAFEDPDLGQREKAYVCLDIIYPDFEDMPEKLYGEAFEAAIGFIDHGKKDGHPGPRTMDWEQDADLLFPAVNHVAGFEVRDVEYMHWWTFLGLFMEIGEGTYSTVLSLRQKKAKHKKLEKWESEWWSNNIGICKLKERYSEEELAEQARLKALLGG